MNTVNYTITTASERELDTQVSEEEQNNRPNDRMCSIRKRIESKLRKENRIANAKQAREEGKRRKSSFYLCSKV